MENEHLIDECIKPEAKPEKKKATGGKYRGKNAPKLEHSPAQLAQYERNGALMKLKHELGIMKRQKYTAKTFETQFMLLFEYFQLNPGAVFIEEYYTNPDTEKLIPMRTLTSCKFLPKYPAAAEMYEQLKKMLEMRIVKGGLTNAFNNSITKFVLQNCYGWKEKTSQDVQLSVVNTEFKFGNPELNAEDGEKNNE